MRAYIEKKQAMRLLGEWHESYMCLSELETGVQAVFGGNESEFFSTIWHGFDRHTRALSAALGDQDEWLGWYFAENNMGANGCSAMFPSGKFRKIGTLAALYKIIVDTRL